MAPRHQAVCCTAVWKCGVWVEGMNACVVERPLSNLIIKVFFITNRPFHSCELSYLAYIKASAARSDLALIQTSLLFALKLVSIRITWFTLQKQWGVYQNKVTCSLAASQRPGHQADNCKIITSALYHEVLSSHCYCVNRFHLVGLVAVFVCCCEISVFSWFQLIDQLFHVTSNWLEIIYLLGCW